MLLQHFFFQAIWNSYAQQDFDPTAPPVTGRGK
jgi:hypothetical protein